MGSCIMLYISSFMKIGSSIQKLIGGIHMQMTRHIHTHGKMSSLA
jgi:hypothetical protein